MVWSDLRNHSFLDTRKSWMRRRTRKRKRKRLHKQRAMLVIHIVLYHCKLPHHHQFTPTCTINALFHHALPSRLDSSSLYPIRSINSYYYLNPYPWELQAQLADDNQKRNDNKYATRKNDHVKGPGASEKLNNDQVKIVSKTNCSVLNVVVSSMSYSFFNKEPISALAPIGAVLSYSTMRLDATRLTICPSASLFRRRQRKGNEIEIETCFHRPSPVCQRCR